MCDAAAEIGLGVHGSTKLIHVLDKIQFLEVGDELKISGLLLHLAYKCVFCGTR